MVKLDHDWQFLPPFQLCDSARPSHLGANPKQLRYEHDRPCQALFESYCRVERHLLLGGPDWVGGLYVGDDEGIQIRQQLVKWHEEKPFRPAPPSSNSEKVAFFDEQMIAARKVALAWLFREWILDATDETYWIQVSDLPAMMRFAQGRLCMTMQDLLDFLDNYELKQVFVHVCKENGVDLALVNSDLEEDEHPIARMVEDCNLDEEHVSKQYRSFINAGTAFPGTLNESSGLPKSNVNVTRRKPSFPSEHEAKVMVMLEHPIEMYDQLHIDFTQCLSAIQDIMMQSGMNMDTPDLLGLLDDKDNDPQYIAEVLVRGAQKLSPPPEESADPVPPQLTMDLDQSTAMPPPDKPVPMRTISSEQQSPRIKLNFSLKAKFTSIFNDFTQGRIELCDALPQFRMAASNPYMPAIELQRLFEQFKIPADMFLDVNGDGYLTYFASSPNLAHGLPNDLSTSPAVTYLPPTPKLAHTKLQDRPPITPIIRTDVAKNGGLETGEKTLLREDVAVITDARLGHCMSDSAASLPSRPGPQRASTPFLELTRCATQSVVGSKPLDHKGVAVKKDPVKTSGYERDAYYPTPRPPGPFDYGKWMQGREETPSTASSSSGNGQTDDLWGITMPTKKARALGRTLGFRKTYVKRYFKSWTSQSLHQDKVRNARNLVLLPPLRENAVGPKSTDSGRGQERRRVMSELFAHRDEDHTAFMNRTLLPLTPEDFLELGQPNVVTYCSSPETYVPSNGRLRQLSASAPVSPTLKRKRAASEDSARQISEERTRKHSKISSMRSPVQSLAGHLDNCTIGELEMSATSTTASLTEPGEKTHDGNGVSQDSFTESVANDSSPEFEDGEILEGTNATIAKRTPGLFASKTESISNTLSGPGIKASDILGTLNVTRDTSKVMGSAPVTAQSRNPIRGSSEQKAASSKNPAEIKNIKDNIVATGTLDGIDARAEAIPDKSSLMRDIEQCEPLQEIQNNAMNGVEETTTTDVVVSIHNTTPKPVLKRNISCSASDEEEGKAAPETATIEAAEAPPPVYVTIKGVDSNDLRKRGGRTVFPDLNSLASSRSTPPSPRDVQMRDVAPLQGRGNSEGINPPGLGAVTIPCRTTEKPADIESVFARVNAIITRLLRRPKRKPKMFTDYNYDPDSPSVKERTRAWNRRGNPPDLDAMGRNQEIPLREVLKRLRRCREERVEENKKLADRCRKSGRYLHQTQNSSSSGSSRASSTASLSKLFDKYRGTCCDPFCSLFTQYPTDTSSSDDPTNFPDTLTITPTIGYFTALSLALDEPAVLALLTILSAPAMGELTRDGFIAGWHSLSPSNAAADTIAKQTPIAHGLRQSLRVDAELWERVYKHTFILARPAGQKAVQLEAAVEYWRLLFGEGGWRWRSEDEGKETPWLEWYLEHLITNWKKSVNKDLWDQTAKFARKSVEDPSMDWWSEDGAWPGVLDEFVGFVKGKRGEP